MASIQFGLFRPVQPSRSSPQWRSGSIHFHNRRTYTGNAPILAIFIVAVMSTSGEPAVINGRVLDASSNAGEETYAYMFLFKGDQTQVTHVYTAAMPPDLQVFRSGARVSVHTDGWWQLATLG